ncbi:MAG: Lrp/AsnC family transcriptional regulator [Methanomassiliicoccaceae archaeon]|jgi:Lrp/AsnC family transcriptional regulator for asnA, asnC and gidA|nr:Lrp/AsnC family transcriptional regulator [Methanomassiliicoccaceae archaeon]
MTEEMDSKDADILERLRKDSRTSMGQIGDSLGISKATVSRRIARLESENVIKGYSLEIDPSKLNVVKSLLSLQVKGSSVSHVIEDLSSYKEVRHIYKAFGDHHLVCEVYTKDVEDLYEMIQSRILKNQSVTRIEVDILIERMVVDENADLKLYRSMNQLK